MYEEIGEPLDRRFISIKTNKTGKEFHDLIETIVHRAATKHTYITIVLSQLPISLEPRYDLIENNKNIGSLTASAEMGYCQAQIVSAAGWYMHDFEIELYKETGSQLSAFVQMAVDSLRKFERDLKNLATEHPGYEIINEQTIGVVTFRVVANGQTIVQCQPETAGYHSWNFGWGDSADGRGFVMEFCIDRHTKEHGILLPEWIRNEREELKRLERLLYRTAAGHPEIKIQREQVTSSYRRFNVVKDDKTVAWFNVDKLDWGTWEWEWTKIGAPFVRDFEIERNKELGSVLPDWVKTEIETLEQQAGRKRLACNVWLDHLVNEKGRPMGNNDNQNELFKIWKTLWKFETGKNPDDPNEAPDPWENYRKAIEGGEQRRKNRKK